MPPCYFSVVVDTLLKPILTYFSIVVVCAFFKKEYDTANKPAYRDISSAPEVTPSNAGLSTTMSTPADAKRIGLSGIMNTFSPILPACSSYQAF